MVTGEGRVEGTVEGFVDVVGGRIICLDKGRSSILWSMDVQEERKENSPRGTRSGKCGKCQALAIR